MMPRCLQNAFLFSVFAQALDVISSMGFSREFFETNPFAQDVTNGGFSLRHGIVVKCIAMITFSLMSAGLYLAIRPFDEKKADVISTAPLLYIAAVAILAAFENTLLHFGYGG